MAANQVVLRGQKEGVEEVKAEFERLRKETNSDWNAVRQGLLEFYASISEDDPRVPLTRFTKVDEKGPFRDDGNINWPGGDGPRYEVLHPITKQPCKLPTSGWRYPTEQRFWEEVARGRVVFGPDEKTVPRVRTNLFENSDQVMVSVHYSYAQTAANQFSALFDGKRVFDNPKPVDDLKELIAYLTNPDDLVLDFFAGSGTTGHAVFLQNITDNGKRRFILVQLPEPLDPDNKEQQIAAEFCRDHGKPLNIAEITKERLRRAGKKIRNENPMFAGDLGFRVFKLASTNIREWDPDRDDLSKTLQESVEHLKTDRTEADILYEVLLKLGLDLTVPIEDKDNRRQESAQRRRRRPASCASLRRSAARRSNRWRSASLLGARSWLLPAKHMSYFRDSAFADDVAKTNLAAILEQNGLDRNVRSL